MRSLLRPDHRAELSALVRLSLPLALANLGHSLMSWVDTAIVGRVSATALAGISLANSLFFFVTLFGMGLMMGLDPMISQAVGASRGGHARSLLWQGQWLGWTIGGALALVSLAGPFVLPLFSIDDAVAQVVAQCLKARALGLPSLLAFVATRSYLQAVGHTRPLVVAILIANVLNALAATLLVHGGAALPDWCGPLRAVPAFGAAGAAWSTTLCSYVQIWVTALSIRGLPASGFTRRPDLAKLWRTIVVGTPIALHMTAEIGVFTLAGLMAGRLGPIPVAAHQIALTYVSLTFSFALGLAGAGSVRVGLAVGAGTPELARARGLIALSAGAAIMGAFALALWAFAHPLATLVAQDPEVLRLGAALLGVGAVFQLGDGAQVIGAGVLRGAADTRFTFLANLLGHYALGVPVAVLLGLRFKLGVVGIWWGLCVGLTAVALALLARFLSITRRPIAPLQQAA
jgi:MATE family multidrug resistance protein